MTTYRAEAKSFVFEAARKHYKGLDDQTWMEMLKVLKSELLHKSKLLLTNAPDADNEILASLTSSLYVFLDASAFEELHSFKLFFKHGDPAKKESLEKLLTKLKDELEIYLNTYS